MKKAINSLLIILGVTGLTVAICYAEINSVTGVGQGTDWSAFTAEVQKSPTKLKRWDAGMRKTYATPVPANGIDGGFGWAADLGIGTIHVVSSDSALKGVQLYTGVAGEVVWLINSSATACNLFPAQGGKINGGSTNGGVIIPASKGVLAICVTGDFWYAYDLTARATVSVSPTPTATPTASP
jgi:hypothetical protein